MTFKPRKTIIMQYVSIMFIKGTRELWSFPFFKKTKFVLSNFKEIFDVVSPAHIDIIKNSLKIMKYILLNALDLDLCHLLK